ncbi:MAG: GTP cyclohydrolase MptA [Candidatus Thermoplasmatota archaeon]|nr:GTP cyclohydrolase MptA [Candidatus Thermoplasmatota archaeon]
MSLPDVQSWLPRSRFKLSRVGIQGIRKQVFIRRPQRTVQLIVNLDVFVDLPASKKGSDLSRNSEVIEEIVKQSARQPASSLEAMCADIAQQLLRKHDYATRSEVHAAADYFLDRVTPSGRRTMEPYRIMAQVMTTGEGTIKRYIGVEVMGMTACPCALETIREACGRDLGMTHNQRNVVTIIMESRGEIDADDLIAIAEASMSSPTYEILKRADEKEVVMYAHQHPKFVEDVVRDLLTNILHKYRDLPDDVEVVVRSKSLESIHKHDAFAERTTTIGELKT